MRLPTRRQLDDWFPSLVRYLGLILMLILVTGAVLDHLDYPSGFIAATAMLLFKTVAKNGNGEAR